MRSVRALAAAMIALGVLLALAPAAPAAVPNLLHSIDTSAMTGEQLAMMLSLQGIVAKAAADGTPQIWISGEIDPDLLNYLFTQFGIIFTVETDPLAVLNTFVPQVKGFEQCDLTLRSLNVASPLAGVDSAVIAATQDLADALSTFPFSLQLKNDVTQSNETFWLGSSFSELNPALLIELDLLATGQSHLRDVSAAQEAFTYTDSALDSTSVRRVAMALTDAHSPVLGFPADSNEIDWIRTASALQHPAVRAETCHDLSVLSGILQGQTQTQQTASHLSGQVTTTDGVHYVTMVMDGGWDIGWTLDLFYQPNWFGNSNRGNFPMGWEISPALLDWAPLALAFFYSQARANDFFVAPPSGLGKLYPGLYPDLAGYAALMGPKVKQSDLRVVNVMGDAGGVLSDARPILDRPEVIGVFYQTNNAKGDYYTGIQADTFDVDNGKVIWPYRYALWNNGMDANSATGIASAILTDANPGSTTPHLSPTTDPLSYSLIAVYPLAYWDGDPEGSSIMDTVASLVAQLQANPAVKIISPEEFAWRLRENFGDGQGGPRFSDVPTTFWAWEDIEAVAKHAIALGFPDGTFQPGTAVDRAQMATFLARAIAGGDASVPSGPAVPSFSDVPTSHFAYKYIEFCKDEKVVSGFLDGSYQPGLAVNRAQMAAFLARAKVAPEGDAGLPPAPLTATFADVPTDFWAFQYIEYVAAQGIALGYPGGVYLPDLNVSRDQMAVFIGRAFGLM